MTNTGYAAPPLDRATATALAGLVGVAAVAWVGVVHDDGMAMGAPAFLAAWVVMMAAMMLPAAAPVVLVHRRSVRAPLATAQLVAGYLGVWAASGVPVYAASAAMGSRDAIVAGVLAAAGLYQVSPLKTSCLRRCRSPLDFLLLRYGRRPLLLGAEHGAYCVGCCWGLMAVLVVAGAMGLAWVAAIALAVFAEKVLPGARTTSRLIGVGMIAAALAVALT